MNWRNIIDPNPQSSDDYFLNQKYMSRPHDGEFGAGGPTAAEMLVGKDKELVREIEGKMRGIQVLRIVEIEDAVELFRKLEEIVKTMK